MCFNHHGTRSLFYAVIDVIVLLVCYMLYHCDNGTIIFVAEECYYIYKLNILHIMMCDAVQAYITIRYHRV